MALLMQHSSYAYYMTNEFLHPCIFPYYCQSKIIFNCIHLFNRLLLYLILKILFSSLLFCIPIFVASDTHTHKVEHCNNHSTKIKYKHKRHRKTERKSTWTSSLQVIKLLSVQRNEINLLIQWKQGLRHFTISAYAL